MRRKTIVPLAAALLASCAHGGPAATLRPVCAPNDAAAVMLQIPRKAGEQYPYFRLRVDQPLGQVAGQNVAGREPDGAGPSPEWCNADGCRVIRAAMPTTVGFGTLQSDSSLFVRVRATGPDGKIFFWAGWAPWKGETLVCG